ncbi:rpl35, partial [Symbiodinium sp. KB8]
VTGAAANRLSQIKVVRKNIARVLTVYNQKARNVWEKKKYLPIDLRYKKTRAIRRALTTHERTQKTLRQQKKDQNFPQRRFALKA